MSTRKREPMPPAATAMDEAFYRLRLETWPRELRNWIKFEERFHRFLAISGDRRKALALASGRQVQQADRPRRTSQQPSGFLKSGGCVKPSVRGSRPKAPTRA